MKRADDMKRKLFLSNLPTPKTPAGANPMRNFASHSNKNESRCSLIDEALGIVNSRQSTPNPTSVNGRRGPMRTKGSPLCERRVRELLTDNSDHLSELLRNYQVGLVDFSSDNESDLED